MYKQIIPKHLRLLNENKSHIAQILYWYSEDFGFYIGVIITLFGTEVTKHQILWFPTFNRRYGDLKDEEVKELVDTLAKSVELKYSEVVEPD